MVAAFSPLMPQSASPIAFHRFGPKPSIWDKLQLPSKAILGGVAQLLLSRYLPGEWAFVPLGICVAIAAIGHLAAPKPSVPPNYIPPTGTSAQFPEADGTYSNKPSSRSLVVLHLGVQSNHPNGFAAPGFKETSDWFMEMHHDLMSKRDEYGLLSASHWQPAPSNGQTSMAVYYFRDVESLHKFAHDPVHRRYWDAFVALKKPYVGVFHELFEVPAGNWESTYLNCQPVSLGAATVPIEDPVDGSKKWANVLVSARNPVLRSMWSRMGRHQNGEQKEGY